MSSDTRIRRLSNGLYWLVNAVLVTAPIAVLWGFSQAWTNPDWVVSMLANLPRGMAIDPSRSVTITLLGCIAAAPLFYAIFQMKGLFNHYRRGDILTEACARHILRIGQGLMVTSVAALLLPTLQTLALTYDNPPGSRMLMLGISGNVVAVFLLSGLLTVIGLALRDAAKIAAENASFV
jgi:hypothetical protein